MSQTTDQSRARNEIANLPVEAGAWKDNLAIALCSYFSDHEERPNDDMDDTETGWSPWTVRKTEQALDIIVAHQARHIAEATAQSLAERDERILKLFEDKNELLKRIAKLEKDLKEASNYCGDIP